MRQYKNVLNYRDLVIISSASLAVVVCFSLIAGLVGNLQTSFAQQVGEEFNATVTTVEGEEVEVAVSSTEALLGQVNATIIAISGLMATAMGIITGIITWLRAKTGDRIISDDSTEWLQSIFEQVRQKDNDLRDVFRQVLEKSAEIDVVVDVVRSNSPELGEKLDAAAPQINQKLQDIHGKIAKWQSDADKLYEVSPKSDPIGK